MRRISAATATTLATLTGAVAPAPAAGNEWRWPVRGEVVESFDLAGDPYALGQHRGIDVAAPRGAAVRAACAGKVRFTGTAGAFGRAVTVACGSLTVSYGHLATIATARGQSVAPGDRLGTVGATGRGSTKGPHLHLGIRRTTDPHGYLDPLTLLPNRRRFRSPPPTTAPRPTHPPPPRGALPRPTTPRADPSLRPRGAIARPADFRPGLPVAVWAGLGLLALAAPGLALVGSGRRRGRAPRAGRAAAKTVAFRNPSR